MPRPRTDIRHRILRAARVAFLSHGVDGASVRQIARAARTSLGMVTYYFENKEALFLAVVEEAYAKILADVDAIFASEGTIWQRLERAFQRLGRASDDEAEALRLILREALGSSKRFQMILERSQRGHLLSLASALAGAVQRGEIEPSMPPVMMLLSVFALGGMPQILRRAAGHEPPFSTLPPSEGLAHLSVDLLARLLGPRPAGAR